MKPIEGAIRSHNRATIIESRRRICNILMTVLNHMRGATAPSNHLGSDGGAMIAADAHALA